MPGFSRRALFANLFSCSRELLRQVVGPNAHLSSTGVAKKQVGLYRQCYDSERGPGGLRQEALDCKPTQVPCPLSNLCA